MSDAAWRTQLTEPQPDPVSPTEKMICSEALEGVPLLVLANKQDVPVRPVLSPGFTFRHSYSGL